MKPDHVTSIARGVVVVVAAPLRAASGIAREHLT
jgi:hypothetical protein